MDYVEYGSTGLRISRLCIGTGHFQGAYANPEDGADFLEQVLERGVTFWDTAESYGSHPHVGAAVRRIDRSRVVLQTKTGEADYEKVKERIDAALQDLCTDYLDVLLLHGVNSPRDLARRDGALKAMLEAKQAGKVRHVGCSTHIYTGPVMDAVTACPEIEVILCTVNREGLLLEGSIVSAEEDAPRVPETPDFRDHIAQVRRAFEAGKGISIMKIIGGGKTPEADREDWIRWGFDFPYAHAVNLGITFSDQLELDVRLEAEQAEGELRLAA
jgi:hypothetical protein